MDFSRYGDSNRATAKLVRCVSRSFVMLLWGWFGVVLPALADNPGYDRPGYGFTPVALAAGEMTIEQGLPDWSRDRNDGAVSSQYSADSLLRLGLGGPVELQLGSSPWNYLRQNADGLHSRSRGHGDTRLGLKLALPSAGKAFSWGLLGSVEFTDGAKDFRSDQRQYLLGAQFNLQANRRNSLGAYLEEVRSGGRDSTTMAFSDNYTLTRTLTLYTEAALLHSTGKTSGTVAGAGLTWMISPRVQFDAGFDHHLRGTAAEWQGNLGVAVYLGH